MNRGLSIDLRHDLRDAVPSEWSRCVNNLMPNGDFIGDCSSMFAGIEEGFNHRSLLRYQLRMNLRNKISPKTFVCMIDPIARCF